MVVELEEVYEFEKQNNIVRPNFKKTIYWYIKRMADVLLSLAGLIIMALPFVVISILIKKDSNDPVFFTQLRVGRDGKLFKIYKFRTMKIKEETNTDDNSDIVTSFGKVLRKTSIDEIPQLLNILKGDMSFVGPRPLVPDEGEIHNLRMKNGVYNVRPGITGLAQVNGRDLITVEQKVKLDTQYVQQYGMLLDIKLMLKTIPKAFAGADIVEGTHTDSR